MKNFLGQQITEEGISDSEIIRIEIARGAFSRMASARTSRQICIETIVHILRCYIMVHPAIWM